MVKYLGTLLVRRQHYQVIESLQGSLRDMLPQFYMEYDTNELRRTFLQGVTQQIVQGLSYLHERSFVHFDLSQDTVAVGFVVIGFSYYYFSLIPALKHASNFAVHVFLASLKHSFVMQ